MLESDKLTPQEQTYFNYQKKIYEDMTSAFEDWATGTLDWIDRVVRTPDNQLSEHELELKRNKDVPPTQIAPNLSDIVLQNTN